jgi:predicted ATPase
VSDFLTRRLEAISNAVKEYAHLTMIHPAKTHVVALTGGPGGGKSTLLKLVSQKLQLTPFIIVLEEAIHGMAGCGLDPRSAEFQRLLVQRQRAREDDTLSVAAREGKGLIVTHRGTLDPCAFWQSFGNTRESFFEMTDITLEDHYRRYGFVMHLESAAVRVPSAYARYPDAHRPESIEQAARLDHFLGELWCSHPHYVKIEGTLDVGMKIDCALRIAYEFLKQVLQASS